MRSDLRPIVIGLLAGILGTTLILGAWRAASDYRYFNDRRRDWYEAHLTKQDIEDFRVIRQFIAPIMMQQAQQQRQAQPPAPAKEQ